MKNKIILIFGIVLVFAMINIVYGDEYCFLKINGGEKIHKTENTYVVCDHPPKYTCMVCVNSSRWSAAWPKCKEVCKTEDINSDKQNLTLNLTLPFSDNGVLEKTSFNLETRTNKLADIDMIDNIYGKLTHLCPGCKLYSKRVNFKEGLNNITMRAVNGNEIVEKTFTFTIDSKKPKISKTEPVSNRYTGSEFSVYYNEDNVKEITLHYGNAEKGYKTSVLENCASGKKQSCSIDISMKEYDNSKIEYWFSVKDIANNIVESRKTKINIDETFPVLNNPDNFWNRGAGRNSNYIYINLNITEINLDKVYYSDNGKRQLVLCSILKNNICSVKKSFSIGEHTLDIQIVDKAGNSVGKQINFVV